jgi:hypothetical protein
MPGRSLDPIREALKAAEPRPATNADRGQKKNYAERLSRHIAIAIANSLRPEFPGITPDESGKRQEAPARTSKGFKKLDVNYSTPELGLALGVSIKTLNFLDASTGRYTKNYSRIDNELRAEATDYHQRQPYSFLVAVLFLPIDSCDDGARGNASSFGAAVRFFRPRANRRTPHDDVNLFELFFIAAYDPDPSAKREVRFFDVLKPPPRARRPRADETISMAEMVEHITLEYNERNDPEFVWAEE